MNSLEILQILSYLPDHTIGVYPSDKIPKKWTIPSALVFNTDDSKHPESHWILIYTDRDQRGWYFASYGIPPFIPSHIQRMRKNCKTLRWNVVQLQSESSRVCGHYCIMFLYYMSVGTGLKKFLYLFGDNYQTNDKIFKEFVSSFVKRNKKKETGKFIGNGGCYASQYPQPCSAKLSLL